MKVSTLLLTTSLIALSSLANAGDKYYVSVTGEYIASAKANGDVSGAGISAPATLDFNDGWGGMAAIGYYITPDIRTELEEGYRQIKGESEVINLGGTSYTLNADNVKEKALTTMANIYYDLPTGTNLVPYVGAGIGWAHETNNGNSNAVAYQGMIGLNYKIDAKNTIYGGYRYIGTSDFTDNYSVSGIDITDKYHAKISALDVGYRFNF